MARKNGNWLEDIVGGLVFWAKIGLFGVPLLAAAVLALVIALAVKW
jgi:hypothetical protein